MSAVEDQTNGKWVGQALRRKEDPRMITGRGNYVDDIIVSGMLHMHVVRSSEAHAKIVSIDATGAREYPGIYGVFTAEDLDIASGLPMAWVPPGVEIKSPEHWPLAKGEVKYVGQGVAIVLGSDKYGVVDAAEQVLVEYEPLPVVVDPEKALEDGSALVHPEFGTNKTHEWSSAAATWTPPGRRPTSSSSGGSSTTARPARRSSRASASPTTAAARSPSTSRARTRT